MKQAFIEIGNHYLNFENISFIEVLPSKCKFHFVGGEYIEINISSQTLKTYMDLLH